MPNDYIRACNEMLKIYKALFVPKRLNELYRVVYGGKYTVLLDKYTGERLAMVTREDGKKNNLYEAVLFLLARFRGVYGTEIDRYIKSGCTTYIGLMQYLLEFGFASKYTPEDVKKLHKIIEDEENPEIGFLYLMLYDRFKYKKDQIDELVKEATCSEKISTKRRKCKKAYEKKLKEKPIRKPSKKTAKSRKDLENL